MTVTLDPLVPLPELGLVVVRRVLPELAEGIDPGGQLGLDVFHVVDGVLEL